MSQGIEKVAGRDIAPRINATLLLLLPQTPAPPRLAAADRDIYQGFHDLGIEPGVLRFVLPCLVDVRHPVVGAHLHVAQQLDCDLGRAAIDLDHRIDQPAKLVQRHMHGDVGDAAIATLDRIDELEGIVASRQRLPVIGQPSTQLARGHRRMIVSGASASVGVGGAGHEMRKDAGDCRLAKPGATCRQRSRDCHAPLRRLWRQSPAALGLGARGSRADGVGLAAMLEKKVHHLVPLREREAGPRLAERRLGGERATGRIAAQALPRLAALGLHVEGDRVGKTKRLAQLVPFAPIVGDQGRFGRRELLRRQGRILDHLAIGVMAVEAEVAEVLGGFGSEPRWAMPHRRGALPNAIRTGKDPRPAGAGPLLQHQGREPVPDRLVEPAEADLCPADGGELLADQGARGRDDIGAAPARSHRFAMRDLGVQQRAHRRMIARRHRCPQIAVALFPTLQLVSAFRDSVSIALLSKPRCRPICSNTRASSAPVSLRASAAVRSL